MLNKLQKLLNDYAKASPSQLMVRCEERNELDLKKVIEIEKLLADTLLKVQEELQDVAERLSDLELKPYKKKK